MKLISKFSGAMGLLLLLSAFSQSGATARTIESTSADTIEARMAAIQEQLTQVRQDLAQEQATQGTTDAELLSQWYDWGDWGDWGDWVDWGDWSDWVDWGDWLDWGDWYDY
ncbi:MAG: GrrA/OscA1 family cyclophane-containing rSAM-modified RiPP [Synechococcales bacterium]|nr:GrrA/OscA1 family cyclophane-containing rSAM-modified RiPP [Synechococcales bacterium]